MFSVVRADSLSSSSSSALSQFSDFADKATVVAPAIVKIVNRNRHKPLRGDAFSFTGQTMLSIRNPDVFFGVSPTPCPFGESRLRKFHPGT